MAELAISAHGLSKRYRVGEVETAWLRLGRRLRGLEGPGSIWACRDLTFDIAEGEAVAIIGRNGAGKSTLLKVLSRITEPTAGYADVRGRVGALLEVGTGFHGELTGRENVYLNGSILGMSRAHVDRNFDRIVEFAGVEEHIDKPVKWYSSGMHVRLGFAVAAHLEPEILIVDEVLAVGDAEFQRQCLGRMSQVAHEGRTVLFVSHNMQAVRRLCERGIMLERGELVMDGDVASVARHYLASLEVGGEGRRRWDPAARPGNEVCRIVEVSVTDYTGEAAGSFFSSQPIHVTIEFDLEVLHPAFAVSFDVLTADGVLVFTSYHRDVPAEAVPRVVTGRNALRCTIPPGLLNSGRYVVNLRVSLHNVSSIAHEDAVLQFDVVADHGESPFMHAQGRSGVILPMLDWAAVEPSSAGPEEVSAARVSASG